MKNSKNAVRKKQQRVFVGGNKPRIGANKYQYGGV